MFVPDQRIVLRAGMGAAAIVIVVALMGAAASSGPARLRPEMDPGPGINPAVSRRRRWLVPWVLPGMTMLVTLVVVGTLLGPNPFPDPFTTRPATGACGELAKIACAIVQGPSRVFLRLAILAAGTVATILLLRVGDRRRGAT